MSLNNMVSKVEQAVRPRHLGIGFVWAWIYCAFSTSALFPNRAGSSINADPSWLASAIAVSACLFLLAFLWRRADMARLRPCAFAGAALMVAGTFCSGAFALPMWANALCGVASGVGSAFLTLFWGDALARIETERVEIAIPAASGVMLCCVFIFPYVQGFPGVCGVSSLPLFSMVCLLLTWSDIDSGKYAPACDAGGGRAVRRAKDDGVGMWSGSPSAPAALKSGAAVFLARILVVLFVAYLAIGVMSALEDTDGASWEAYDFDIGTFVGSACGVGMAFWFIFFSPRVNVVALLRWVVPILVVGLSAMPFSGLLPGFATSTTSSIADTVLQAIAILSLVSLARNGVFPAAFAVGLGQGAIQLGVLVGNVFGSESVQAIGAGDIEEWMVSIFAVCLLSVAMAIIPSNGREASYWKLSGEADRDGVGSVTRRDDARMEAGVETLAATDDQPRGARAKVPSARGESDEALALGTNSAQGLRPADATFNGGESLDDKVARIAAEGGLSARETEVLGYLARGRSQPYIRDALVLSKNTVASHVKHIYQKLDVHSRQELLDLFAE